MVLPITGRPRTDAQLYMLYATIHVSHLLRDKGANIAFQSICARGTVHDTDKCCSIFPVSLGLPRTESSATSGSRVRILLLMERRPRTVLSTRHPTSDQARFHGRLFPTTPTPELRTGTTVHVAIRSNESDKSYRSVSCTPKRAVHTSRLQHPIFFPSHVIRTRECSRRICLSNLST